MTSENINQRAPKQKNLRNIISISHLTKSFGNKIVLSDISCDINAQESVVIVGGSGCGKSVFIKCICGLMLPDHGSSIKIADNEVAEYPISTRNKLATKIGFLFQNNALFDSMTVAENIIFAIKQSEQSDNQSKKSGPNLGYNQTKSNKSPDYMEYVAKSLNDVGLNPLLVSELYPNELSGGMQKRVALARAIVDKPHILFCDEPTSGLDPLTAKMIANLVNDVRKSYDITVISISHDPIYTSIVADRIIFLDKGQIMWTGPLSGNHHILQNATEEKLEFLEYFLDLAQ